MVNRVLARLPADEIAVIAPCCEQITLSIGDVLCEAGDPIRSVVFPYTGIIALRAPVAEGPAMAIGLLGREGMFGVPLILGVAHSTVAAVVQGKGRALRISATAFRRVIGDCPVLAARGRRYTAHLLAQFACTAVCNGCHSIESRTARWLLSTGDRMESDVFTLTQSLLAEMLGVRRPAINRAARTLLADGLVAYSRGEVRIVDRPGLEIMACSCYSTLRRQHRAALTAR